MYNNTLFGLAVGELLDYEGGGDLNSRKILISYVEISSF